MLKDFYTGLYRDDKAAILGHIYSGGIPNVSIFLIKALAQYAVDVSFKGTMLEPLAQQLASFPDLCKMLSQTPLHTKEFVRSMVEQTLPKILSPDNNLQLD